MRRYILRHTLQHPLQHAIVYLCASSLFFATSCSKDKSEDSSKTDKKKSASKDTQKVAEGDVKIDPKGGSQGGASPKKTARQFIKAAAKRDIKAAANFLMDEKVCSLSEKMKSKKSECLGYVSEVKKQLPEFLKSIPKDFEIQEILVKKPSHAPEGMNMVVVFPKGKNKPVQFVTVNYKGRFYIGLGIKKKVKMKPNPMSKAP